VFGQAVLQHGGEEAAERRTHQHILVVDDSSVARKQIVRTLEQLGVTCTVACDGRQALTLLQKLVEEEIPLTDRFAMVISDVEMPEIDGYTLTTEIRKYPRLKLHTSLSGVFNAALVQKVGADTFLPKFHADDLAQNVIKCLEQASAQQAA
jgi:two-component system chemotaxis response regulator CheV